MLRKNRYYQAVTITGIYAAIATCFFIPLSTSLMDLFALVTFACWILSGKVFELPKLMKRSPVALVSVLLFLLFVIGIFYSSADLLYSLEYFKKYREIIYLPAVISILEDNQQAKINAEYSFVIGCMILLCISYLMHFSLFPIHRYGDSILFHITHSFFMAILAYWSAHYLIESKQYRYLWLFVLAAAIYNTIFIAPGRTGMFVLFILLILFVFQRLSLKKQILAFLLLCSLFTGSFFISNNFSTRLDEAWHEIATYHHGTSRTSLGQRLDWWNDSLELIKRRPIFGYGTGGFTTAHNQLIKGTDIEPTDNPHNEYLFITVQLGLIGLILFLALFITQWVCSQKLPDKDKYLVQGIVLAMAAGCIMNSFLFDSHQGHFFAFLSGIFFAATPRCPLAFKKIS
jgi:O-antigen ligase